MLPATEEKISVSPVKWEYIAGFFDGEGFISIQKASPRTHSGARYWLIAAMVNTNKDVLEKISQVAGGKVFFHREQKRDKPHYRITFYTRQAYDFLLKVRPHLIVKARQADVAIAFSEAVRQYRYCGVRHTEDIVRYQHECYEKIRQDHGSVIRRTWHLENGEWKQISG